MDSILLDAFQKPSVLGTHVSVLALVWFFIEVRECHLVIIIKEDPEYGGLSG